MSIVDAFLRSAAAFPDRPALEVGGVSYSYNSLHGAATGAAYAFETLAHNSHFCIGILAHRSQSAYAFILGALLTDKAYLPLNPKFPPARLATIVEASGCTCIAVGKECQSALNEILPLIRRPLHIIFFEQLDESANNQDGSPHVFVHVPTLRDSSTYKRAPTHTTPSSPAYILFTSGSTGTPKGVPVTHGNVSAYLSHIGSRFQFLETDRFSQTFDLSFDLSVHDMFVCWGAGACLCVLPDSAVMAPAKFIKDNQLSVWFSVPSVAMFMSRIRMLKPHAFPSLRLSFFCGEAFSQELAQLWQAAAPNSAIHNLYGPTEATIAITEYMWDSAHSPEQCRHGIVPIGTIFPGHEFKIVDSAYAELPPGHSGQLLLSGPQITPGYLNDPERTAVSFIPLGEGASQRIWYATGDLAQSDAEGCIYYLGRIDDQIQILGYRAELQEIDSVLRSAAQTAMAVAVPWPAEGSQVQGIIGFVSGSSLTSSEIILRCKSKLPDYMVPREIRVVSTLPLNSNGKVDRKALRATLKE